MTITRSPKTIVVYDITGLDYTVPFEYLARKFVVVTLIGELGRLVLTLNTDYRFTTPTQISLNTQPEAGYTTIEIRRVTSATDRLVDFHDGSILRSRDLNISSIQTLHVAEEARDLTSDTLGVNDDGNLDARGRKIVNLGKGTDEADAVNVGQLREFDTSTANNADRAEAAANRADADAANALESANNAKTSETNAKVSESNAAGSASTANTAAMDARKSYEAVIPLEENVQTLAPEVAANAEKAKQEADRAQEISDNLGDLSGLPPRVDKLETDVADVTPRVSTLEGEVNTKVKSYDARDKGTVPPSSVDSLTYAFNTAANLGLPSGGEFTWVETLYLSSWHDSSGGDAMALVIGKAEGDPLYGRMFLVPYAVKGASFKTPIEVLTTNSPKLKDVFSMLEHLTQEVNSLKVKLGV